MTDLGGVLDGSGEVALSTVLVDLGVPAEEVEQAAAVNRLELLAMAYFALPPGERYDEAQVAELVGCPVEVSRAYWRALGFPMPDSEEKVFTDEDVVMMRSVLGMLRASQIGDDLSLEMTRVIGSAMARIALAEVDVLDSELTARSNQSGDEDADRPKEASFDEVVRAAQFLPLMPEIFSYVWKRHLAAGARARLALAAGNAVADEQVVGFADLVGYTALSQQLSHAELARVVRRFEATAHDVITGRGGRVVKLIGDGVMFSADDVETGAEIALDLAASYRDDDELSDVRVGLAVGPALRRDGDLYGPTVNLASRIVNVAYPGTVLLGERMMEILGDDPRYDLKKVRSHNLKDIGRTRLWKLARVDEPDRNEPDGGVPEGDVPDRPEGTSSGIGESVGGSSGGGSSGGGQGSDRGGDDAEDDGSDLDDLVSGFVETALTGMERGAQRAVSAVGAAFTASDRRTARGEMLEERRRRRRSRRGAADTEADDDEGADIQD